MSEVKMSTLDMWSFPDLNNAILEQQQNKIFLMEQSNRQMAEQLENLQSEYKKKIETVNQLITKLQNPLLVFDKEITELLEHIIKTAVKKIVIREIKTDHHVIHKMIEGLLTLSHEQKNIVTVYLAETDYEQLQKVQNESLSPENMTLSIKSDAALKEGDVVIKSDFSEIRALLVDRINQLMELKDV